MSEKVVIRADGSNGRGYGHVVRCTALAQALKAKGAEPVFVMKEEQGMEFVKDKFTAIKIKGASLEKDLVQTKEIVQETNAVAVVTDSYDFDEKYLAGLSTGNMKVVTVDDLNKLKEYPVAIVVNQNIYAKEMNYSFGGRTLLGTEYAMIRKDFLETKGEAGGNTVPKVLVSAGGSDFNNVAAKAARAFAGMPEKFEPVFVLGKKTEEKKAIYEALHGWGNSFRVEEWVEDMPLLMKSCDFALSAAGTSIYELAFCGTPTLTAVQADNQEGIAEGMEEAGFSLNLGRAEEITEEGIQKYVKKMLKDKDMVLKMAENGRQLVDGAGAQRVAKAILGEKNE